MQIFRRLSLLSLSIFAISTVFGAAAPELQLIDAAKKGNAGEVRSLIAKKVNVNAPASDTSTALHWAVEAGSLDAVNALLDAGASATACTSSSMARSASASVMTSGGVTSSTCPPT